MQAPQRKYITRALDVKAINEDGTFSGYGSVFGVVDSYNDRVMCGAFLKSLADHAAKKTMPLMFLNHSTMREIGEWAAVSEDAKGLLVSGRLWIDGPTPDPDALKAYRGMKKKAGKMGLSIGYSVPENGARFDIKSGITDLVEIDLWEVSPVAFPANDAARIDNVRSEITNIRDFELFLRESGFSRSQAIAIASRGFKGKDSQGEPDAELIESAKRLLSALKKLT